MAALSVWRRTSEGSDEMGGQQPEAMHPISSYNRQRQNVLRVVSNVSLDGRRNLEINIQSCTSLCMQWEALRHHVQHYDSLRIDRGAGQARGGSTQAATCNILCALIEIHREYFTTP